MLKKYGIIVKSLFLVALMAGMTLNIIAQENEKKVVTEKALKRPGIVGHAAIDKFVDSSFDIYERNIKLTDKLSNLAGNTDNLSSIRSDINNQYKEMEGLLNQSAEVMKQAKSITPKPKSIKASKAVNAATKALSITKENLPKQMEKIKAQKSK